MSYNWNDVLYPFCESLLHGYPEYGNSISSFIYCFVGFWGMFMSQYDSDVFRLIFASYIHCGIGSFLYHAYGYRFYGLMDILPMMLLSWLLVYKIFSIYSYRLLFNSHPNVYDKLCDFMATFCVISLFFSIGFSVGYAGHPWGIKVNFTTVFVVPQLINIFLILTSFLIFGTSSKDDRLARKHMIVGFLMCVAGATIWLSTEPRCRLQNEDGTYKYPYLPYIPSHLIWHICMAMGSYMMITTGIYYDMLNQKTLCRFRDGWFYRIFPLVEFSLYGPQDTTDPSSRPYV